MKKILKSFIVSLLVLGSVSTAFAYPNQSSCTLKKDLEDHKPLMWIFKKS